MKKLATFYFITNLVATPPVVASLIYWNNATDQGNWIYAAPVFYSLFVPYLALIYIWLHITAPVRDVLSLRTNMVLCAQATWWVDVVGIIISISTADISCSLPDDQCIIINIVRVFFACRLIVVLCIIAYIYRKDYQLFEIYKFISTHHPQNIPPRVIVNILNRLNALGQNEIMAIPMIPIHHAVELQSVDSSAVIQNITDACSICYDELIQIAMLLPCNHATICYKCVQGIDTKRCPLCRSTFTQIVVLNKERVIEV